ncbi:anthranilate O-methyltransferase 3-like [Oryza glaberrima]|uniref:anthranilate O-methyltransferase 3-like n=1 Tax=Oryza glaberrima TaxID=4538 RepID=UPI00224C2A43|nr:anthranilate O-methyltransferase 3-like [Oryza glaberrima]
MKMERDFHMINGDGDSSYANNSSIQRKAIIATQPMVENAIQDVCADLQPQSMVVADLGCSSGANTLLFVSEVIATASEKIPTDNKTKESTMEVQFFLNDLPGNDFNHIFRLLEQFKQSTMQHCTHRGLQPPPHYVAGMPGSFYTRLFPCNSVHLFHSSFSLMWLSQVPEHLDNNMNKGNIHIGVSTPPLVAQLYLNQFEKDFSRFLQLRCKELVPGGRMVLTILGRKNSDVIHGGGAINSNCELLSQALHTLIAEGCVEQEKLDSFNMPMYGPSPDELKQLVQRSQLLDMVDIQVFDLTSDAVEKSKLEVGATASATQDNVHEAIGHNNAATLRAIMESLFANHFGESIIDDLFAVYAHNVTQQLETPEKKGGVTVISMSLQTKVLK